MEKQIEEMAKDICRSRFAPDTLFCKECETECLYYQIATALTDKGYRKASEIFEEIEEILDRHSISHLKVGEIYGEHYYDGAMQFDIAELKKKYTEDGE